MHACLLMCVLISFHLSSLGACVRGSYCATGSALRAADSMGSAAHSLSLSAGEIGQCNTHTHTNQPACLDDKVLKKVCLSHY